MNGEQVCKLKFGYYRKLDLAPGDYVFAANASKSRFVDRQTVHVVAGQTIYFGCYLSSAFSDFFAVADDQAGAREIVSHLKQQK